MRKTPLLNSLNTFLVSLWGHSLILGHSELKSKSISAYDVLWWRIIRSVKPVKSAHSQSQIVPQWLRHLKSALPRHIWSLHLLEIDATHILNIYIK